MQYVKAVFEAVNVCLMLIDEKGAVRVVNNATSSWVGKDVGDCSGACGDVLDCVHAFSSPGGCGTGGHCPECPIRRAFETAIHDNRPVHNVEVELCLKRQGRQERLWLDVSADPLTLDGLRYAVLTIYNITEVKHAQEVLRRDKETLEKLARETAGELKVRYAMLKRAEEVGRMGCWLLDLRTDELVWSDQVFSIFGVPHGKLSYADFLAAVHPEDRVNVEQKWNAALKGEPYDIEHRILVNGTEVKWVREKAELEFDERGNPVRGIGVVQDISSRKLTEQEHGLLQQEMTRVARHALLGEFSSALAHELNQPLAAILTNAQAARRFLEGKKPDVAEIREIIDDIARDTARAGDIIRKLRLLLNKGELSMQRVDISALLRDTVSFVKNELMLREISLHITEPVDVAVMADATQMQQVFLNLIRNACEALDGFREKHIWIGIERTDEGTVRMSVRDSGKGFTASPDELFKPFYTTKSSGMGMGLAISKRIIESHGGRIAAQNFPGGGALISIELPAADKEGIA